MAGEKVEVSRRGGGGPDGAELEFTSSGTYHVGTLGWCSWAHRGLEPSQPRNHPQLTAVCGGLTLCVEAPVLLRLGRGDPSAAGCVPTPQRPQPAAPTLWGWATEGLT